MAFSNLVSLLHHHLPWVPLWTLATALTAILGAAIFIAQDLAIRFIARHIANRYPAFQLLFFRSRAIARVGVVIFAISIATPFFPLSEPALAIAQNVLVAALVVLVGWAFVIAANMTADTYLNRLDLEQSDNLSARKAVTQVRVLKRTLNTVIIALTAGFALMTFQSVRQFGISIFASAGVAGIVLGLAARPVLANLIAGVQIALTQPIRIDDAIVLEGEWGWIEELTATYVVVRLWDRRRLIVPLSYFLEKPFQNWTRSSASIIGTVMLYLDHTAPIGSIRDKVTEIATQSKYWDGDVANLQVTDTRDYTIEIRILVSAANSPAAWDLRCEMREKILSFIQAEHPLALPKRRNVAEPVLPANRTAIPI